LKPAVPLLAALLGACAPPDARPAGSISTVDDVGDTVRLAAPAGRVVSLAPATTELLFAIGAGPNVVGRTRWCDYPAAARAVPDLGDGLRPNVEAVTASRPDLVVLYRSAQNREAADRLRALGDPVAEYQTDRLADVPRVARALGLLTGHTAEADSLAAGFDSALARVSLPPQPDTPRILILVWDQPPMTVGAGSFLSELVERAGGRNLFDDLPAPSGTVSIEAIATRDPDAILLTSEGEPGFADRAEWRVVRAVQQHRFIRVSGSAFSRPSPRAPEAIRQLRERLAAWR
jgi:ABC-type Fe3+-hydroxamate transport system substrate-binding protein